VLYIAAMWIAGVMQGLMWRAVNPDGTLVYSFVESVKATFPFYVIRLLGGLLYLSGMLIMAWNVVMTVAAAGASPRRFPLATGARLSTRENTTWLSNTCNPTGHEKIETSNFLMIVLILLAVAVGGLVEIVPLFFQRSTTQPAEGLKPYTRCSWPGATSTSARAATTATRR
jgi:hypothetical protein